MRLVNSSLSVIFDLDGTLVDSLPGITMAIQHALRQSGIVVTSMLVRNSIGPPIRDMLRKIAATASEEEILLAEQDFRSIYESKGWQETYLFSSTRETLRKLDELGARLFLFTNKPKKVANQILDELGISGFFVDRLSRDSRTPSFENKGEMLQELMAKHSLSAKDCVVVGDSHEDFQAARQLGVRFVFANYGYGRFNHEEESVRVKQIDDLNALLAL